MADDETGETGEAPPKKSKMMLFIILAIVLLLAGGGGFFAYKKFMVPPPPPEDTPHKAELPEPVGEMVTLNEFVVNLADPKGKRYLKCTISIEVAKPEAVERIQKIEPKLRDIVIMLLTSLSFEEVMTPEGKIRIRDELLERFNQVVRPDKLTHLYFTNFVVQ